MCEGREAMSNKAVDEFFDLLDGDEELRIELRDEIERAAAAAMIGVAGRRGIEFTHEDLEGQLSNQMADLSEEELEAVAGGLSLKSNIFSRPSILSVATAGSPAGFVRLDGKAKTIK
jgi:predicted ribosomally synthesized peptide with nif11-like leader